MEKKQIEMALSNANTFLIRKMPILYGGRNIRFDLESRYLDFDGMLKREIVYCKFDVVERIAECRIRLDGSSLQILVDHEPLPAGPDNLQEPEAFSAFLVRRRYLTLVPDRTFRLALPSYEGALDLAKGAHGGFSLATPGMRPRYVPHAGTQPPSLDLELEAWLRQALSEWASQVRGLRIDMFREAATDGMSGTLSAWKWISQIDIDLSGEDVPHVFRWQECARMAQAAYTGLSEQECLAILAENRTEPPKDSRLIGISRFEVDDDNGCVALRYAHILADPVGGAPGENPTEPYRRNPGFIVVERDFWEFHIDANDRMLIGEYRKWRAVDSR